LYARAMADSVLEGRANAVAEVVQAAKNADEEFVEVEQE
jgi:small subunit ribosomal protein S2